MTKVVRECRKVLLDSREFLALGDVRKLAMPDGKVVEVTPVKTQEFPGRGVVWHGVIEGKQFSNVTFSTVRNSVVGTIAFDGHMYRLRTLSGGPHVIEELDPASLPTDSAAGQGSGDGADPEPPTAACTQLADGCKPSASQCSGEDPVQIDVLVLYTSKARDELQGEDALNAWVIHQEFEANESYRRSELTHRIRVVYVGETAYQETSNYWSREHMIEDADPNLNAHALRNDYIADVVVLLTHATSSGGAGLAYIMDAENLPKSPGDSYIPFDPYAYAVVDALGFETTEFVFAHELGHLMGAEHNKSITNTSQGAIPGSSHGFVEESPLPACAPFMTIMSQREPVIGEQAAICLSCDRIPVWSNTKTATQCSDAMGDATANNRDTLEQTATFVSQFRCGASGPGDVWMKDTWNDSGAEPDPRQVDADMWKSPYIWVRYDRDSGPAFPAQHLHQNPIPGGANYVYAKLLNDGNQAEGVLKVWAAESATALQWPADFSLIGSVAIADFPAKTVRIVEIPWTPTEGGPIALVAQWISDADPAPSSSSTSPDALARSSNNVVWRNLNVIELTPGTDEASTDVIVRSPADVDTYGRVVIRPSDVNPRHSFLLHGDIIVQLDEGLMRAWERTGYQGRGFERAGNQLKVTDPSGAILDALALDARSVGKMRIVFRLSRERRRKGKFHVDVVQSQLAETTASLIGGASFEIQVPARQ